MSKYLNLDTFRNQPVQREPYPWHVQPEFVKPETLDNVIESYPKVSKPGSFPLPGLKFGGAFAELIKELEGPEVRQAFQEKFETDLTNRPTMITARGMCRARDGAVHTDSRTKIITVLIYLNRTWGNEGGCLRLLRSPSMDDCITEVAPSAGTLISFLNTENAWHGHASYEGPRQVIQLNWVTDTGVVKYEQRRHRFSAFLKKLNPF
ncbi:MAG TPA: 2OG-Fe(II) oxygenase [Verrucomicrobiales bacterium]|jgi:hypothetical protein|nr:2OG-Fe(II) oxygenase [Verrucomicrobiales bacterium]